MRAVVCRTLGPPDLLSLETLDSPRPGPGQVRIAIHACGVNFADTLLIQGRHELKGAAWRPLHVGKQVSVYGAPGR